MARDIQGKLAAGETLDDDDITYAMDRGIALPEEYEGAVATMQAERVAGQPPTPVFQTGAFGFGPSAGPGIFISEDQLNQLKKKELETLADLLGKDVDMSDSKSDMVAALVGAEAPPPPEVTPEMHAENTGEDEGEPESEG
jgi:hypothetical protein